RMTAADAPLDTLEMQLCQSAWWRKPPANEPRASQNPKRAIAVRACLRLVPAEARTQDPKQLSAPSANDRPIESIGPSSRPTRHAWHQPLRWSNDFRPAASSASCRAS